MAGKYCEFKVKHIANQIVSSFVFPNVLLGFMLFLQTLYTEVASNTLGPNMTKALYRGYTDATFTTLADAPAQHGLLGPLIVAEVRMINPDPDPDPDPDPGPISYPDPACRAYGWY